MFLKHIFNHFVRVHALPLISDHKATLWSAYFLTLWHFSTTSQSGVFCRWLAQTDSGIKRPIKDLRCSGSSWAPAGRKAGEKLAWMKNTHGIMKKKIIIVLSAEREEQWYKEKYFKCKIHSLAFDNVLCKQRPTQKQQIKEALMQVT